MATENPMRITGNLGMSESERTSSSSSSTTDSVAQELGLLLRSHSRLDNLLNKRDLMPHRSGSAPPSVEGSLASMGGLLNHRFSGVPVSKESNRTVDSERDLRSDPAYLAYYYSHVNLNPRLPPPLVTRDNYVLAQRLASGGDKKKLRSFDDINSRSLFSSQPMLPTHDEEPEFSEDEKSPLGGLMTHVWNEQNADGGLYGNNRPKSLVDLIQEDFPRTPSPVFTQLRPSSRIANEEGTDGTSTLGQLTQIRDSSSMSAAAITELNAVLLGSRSATPINSGLGSRSTTPNPIVGSRSSTPNPSLGHMMGNSSCPVARRPTPEPDISMLNRGSNIGLNGSLSGASGSTDLSASLQKLSLSSEMKLDSNHQELLLNDQHSLRHLHASQLNNRSQVHSNLQVPEAPQQRRSDSNNRGQAKHNPLSGQSSQTANLQNESLNNMYAAAAAAAAMSYMAANPYYQSLQAYTPYGYGVNPTLMPSMMANYPSPVAYDSVAAAAAAAAAAAVAAGIGGRSPSSGSTNADMYKYASQGGGSSQSHLQNPLYYHYLQQYAMEDARSALNLNDPSSNFGGYNHRVDSVEMQKNHMPGYDQKNQYSRSGSYGIPMAGNTNSLNLNPGYYGSPPGVGFMMPYASSPVSSPVLPGSPLVPGAFSMRHGDRNLRFSSGSRNTGGNAYMGWPGQNAADMGEEPRGNSLLEELKNNKARRLELEDIVGHVVEFSADQHGSRFIQQKLETVSMEEKASIFQEVLPHTLTLMTDVFGNYVIQKFFEHGSPEQRSELAEKLVGHVLNLSLQMYGCRVIQKALEVIDSEQQIRLISELDGHVMQCVRDQNGNHVIQKCIECVPPDHIDFILSAFHGQVVVLSTHPYGCRVIQRVLEHCTDDQKQDGVMEEILRSACTLAQDQYGNYVVQHILEHGKANERSEILTKMAGQIVKMSQHKFASNVVEKCLEFGGADERQILIREMLGLTDENEPLQAMMKDQYANYVVQKVLETCDDEQREMLLSRIRVHLHALKKYTYGKHIVARVEKLVAAGERRGALVSTM